MSDSIFRPLVNVLPDAVFEMLQGIGEAAVEQARDRMAPSLHHRPSQTTQLSRAIEHGLGRFLCEQYGWVSAASWRHRDSDSLVIAGKLACGHEHRMSIDEFAIEVSSLHGILDLIDLRWQKSREQYQCYCVPRFGTVQA